MASEVAIRPERPEDLGQVFAVNASAFPTIAEAELVDALRRQARPLISLVAELDGIVIGHVLFSPVTVGEEGHRGMGLGPMAVVPEHQRTGVGGRLIEAGLEACRELGERFVVVLGHAAYYPRFGFRPAAEHGLRFRGPELDPYFFAFELAPGALEGIRGEVRYHAAFGGA